MKEKGKFVDLTFTHHELNINLHKKFTSQFSIFRRVDVLCNNFQEILVIHLSEFTGDVYV